MSLSKATWFVAGLATAGLFSGAVTFAIAQAPSQEVITKLENNHGIFVDKTELRCRQRVQCEERPVGGSRKNGCTGSVGRCDHLPLW